MPLYGAIDLHSNNNYLVVIDQKDQVVLRRRGPNVLEVVLQALEPFGKDLVGVAVESTYNWYWMVDGLMEAGYPVHLVNTAAVRPYEGIKYSNDWTDAAWLAHLLRGCCRKAIFTLGSSVRCAICCGSGASWCDSGRLNC